MKSTFAKSLIAVALLLAGAHFALADGSDAELTLKPSATSAGKGQEFTVDVILKNPSKQDVISVRSWLSYDPMLLQATALDTKDSPFTLAAPGEDNISAADGQIMIGRSNISGGVTDPEVKVATVHFQVQSAVAGKATLGFFDYQVSELGHTSVNIIDSGFPLNILGKEPDKLVIDLNPEVATPTPVTSTPVANPVTTTAPVSTVAPAYGVGGDSGTASELARPLNLMANTGSGTIDLKWDSANDPYRVGYNIYYGKTSGQYTRRRTIGNVNAFRLEGLTNNEVYYLSVTAYDTLNRESDYSNEVGIIVNQPLSSTAPFDTSFDQNYRKIPQQPQNGPLMGWVLFSSAGLSGSILFARKRKISVEALAD
jgi:hypothetical protein